MRISIPTNIWTDMNKTFLIITGLVAAFGIFVWQLLKPPENIAAAVAESASAAQVSVAPASITPSAPIAPARAATSPPVQRVARTVVPLKSALAQEFEKAKELKQFYDRYAANPEGASAELKYFAASAIETCVGRGRAVGSGTVGGSGLTDAARAKFQSKLKDNDPANSQRIAAFERVNQICEGFQSLNLTGADAIKLFREAAAAGNPGARVALAAEEYRDQVRSARGTEERRLSEDQLNSVRDGLSTGDPFAIQRAGQLLSWGSSQLTDRGVGPNNEPFNVRDFGPAWTLAACDRGANCGADAYRVLNGCAQLGACGYDSLETYMQYNELPPNAYANAQQYRSMILDAIEQRRWDWLGIAQGSGRTVTVTPQAAVKPSTQTGRSG
jgi:hypothetical protein